MKLSFLSQGVRFEEHRLPDPSKTVAVFHLSSEYDILDLARAHYVRSMYDIHSGEIENGFMSRGIGIYR